MNHLSLHQLSAYLDGELTEASTDLVRLHLSQCAACTERFARMEAQEEILVRLLRHDPGEAFFEFFRSAIDLDGREASPTWPAPEPTAAESESSLDLVGGTVGLEAEAESEIPLDDLDALFDGDPEALIPNVDAEATPAPAPDPRPTPTRPAAMPTPPTTRGATAPVHSPALYGRREEDQAPPPLRRGGAAGWVVAAVMTVVALSVAFVTSRPRVSPLPIPAVEHAPTRGPGTEAPPGGAPTEAPGPDAEAPSAPDSMDGDSTSLTGTLGDPDEEPERSLDLLDLPVWARAKAIQPPPPPRPRTPATGAPAPEGTRSVERAPRHIVPVPTIVTTTTIDSSGGAAEDAPGTATETAPDPAATAREFASAKQRSLDAAGAMTAPSFEAAAAAWQALLPRLAGDPEGEATAWREAAQARFQAWSVGPTPARRDAAIHAVRGYLLYAPPGPDRDQAWTWLGRLKRAAGTATR